MRFFPALVIGLCVLAGCSRARVTTEIRGGGAFTRTVALTGQEKKEGQISMGGGIEDDFVVPSGEGWKTRSEKKDLTVTATFEQSFAAGRSVKGDLSIKGDGKGEGNAPLLVNEMTVTPLPGSRFEYRETLRWSGPAPDGMKLKAEDLSTLKAALPQPLATDENARALALKVGELAMPMLFGPGDPLLTIGLLHPDLAGRRLSQRIGSLMIKALEEQFGNRMTPAQRRDVTLKLIETSVMQTRPTMPDPGSGPPAPSKGSGLTPLMFVVKTPGKIISSNGELDDLTGEVYWALFPPAAALKPVVLTAVVQVN